MLDISAIFLMYPGFNLVAHGTLYIIQDQTSPDSLALEQPPKNGKEVCKGQDGGQVQEGQQVEHQVWALPELFLSKHRW